MDPVEMQARLSMLEARLERLERRFAPDASPGAPPRVAPASAPIGASGAEPISRPVPVSRPPVQNPDYEALWGKNAFAILGAGLVAVALVVLTSLLLQRGYITKEVQYGLTWLVSAGFVGAGTFVERRGGTQGEVLKGLGSLGAYLTSAAGWNTFGLYEDRVALGLVVIVAVLNLGYGAARGSRAFVWLGLLGGSAAAAGAYEHYLPATVIQLTVGFVAGTIAWRRGWLAELWGAWGLGTLGLAVAAADTRSVLFASTPILRVVPLLLATAVATPYLRARSLDSTGFTGSGALPALVGAGAAWFGGGGASLRGGDLGAVGLYVGVLLLWTLFAGALAFRTSKERQTERIGFGIAAFLTGGLALPATLPARAHLLTLAGLALVSALVSLRPSRLFRALGVAWLAAATEVWGLAGSEVPGLAASLGGAVIALALLAGVLREPRKKTGEWLDWGRDLVAGLLGFGYVAWAVAQAAPKVGVISPTPKFAVAGFAALLLGIVTGRKGLRYAGWPFIAVGVATVLFYDLSELDPAIRIGLLLLFGIAALGVAAWYARASKGPSPEASDEGP